MKKTHRREWAEILITTGTLSHPTSPHATVNHTSTAHPPPASVRPAAVHPVPPHPPPRPRPRRRWRGRHGPGPAPGRRARSPSRAPLPSLGPRGCRSRSASPRSAPAGRHMITAYYPSNTTHNGAAARWVGPRPARGPRLPVPPRPRPRSPPGGPPRRRIAEARPWHPA